MITSQKVIDGFKCYLVFLVYCLENPCFNIMGRRSKYRVHKHICMLKTPLQHVFMRDKVPSTASQCEVFTNFLCDQLLAYTGDRNALHSTYMYVLVHDKHTYIGRCDCLRKSKTWGGGPSHRFQEHVRCHVKRIQGTVSEKQRRTRYMLLAQSCNICPTLIVFDKVHQSIAAAA